MPSAETRVVTGRDDSPEILFHLRWVGRIALLVGALAAAGLAAFLYLVADPTGRSYGELIQSHSITQGLLRPGLIVGGIFLLAIAAVITWMIALYSSFRVAGPLFRFSRNLRLAVAEGARTPIPIREGDRLHAEARMLHEAMNAVHDYYAELDAAITAARECAADPATRAESIRQLRALHDRAHT
jgi:hypothetical protein